MRLVLDTNTVVSGFLWERAERALIDAAIEERIELVTSQPLLDELAGVLARSKFSDRLAAQNLTIQALIERYSLVAEVVVPAEISPVMVADPPDDLVLATALAGRVDFIVSGDKRLRNLKSFHGIAIVNATVAIARISVRPE